jgi:hypothetical protein
MDMFQTLPPKIPVISASSKLRANLCDLWLGVLQSNKLQRIRLIQPPFSIPWKFRCCQPCHTIIQISAKPENAQAQVAFPCRQNKLVPATCLPSICACDVMPLVPAALVLPFGPLTLLALTALRKTPFCACWPFSFGQLSFCSDNCRHLLIASGPSQAP